MNKPISALDLFERVAEMNQRCKEATLKQKRDEDIIKTKWTLSGPRFAHLKSFLKDIAFTFDLEMDIDEDVGWFSAKYWITLTGKRKNVNAASDAIQKSIEEYNR